MRAPKARAKIFKEIIKTELIIYINVQRNHTKKSYIFCFPLSLMKSPDFLKKGQDFMILSVFKIDCKISLFSLTLDKKDKKYWPSKRESFFLNIKKMWKVGRIHFKKVRPKGKKCAMTGAPFSEKCARGNFFAPFAQWRSPNASLTGDNKEVFVKHEQSPTAPKI